MSSIFSKIKKVFNDPRLIVGELNRRGFFKCLSDEAWIKMMFRVRMGRKLNLESPQTYSEKLQWLKLHDRNAETETCFDFFDRDFKHLPFRNGHPNSTKEIKKPENYEEMFELAEKLGKDIPQARIDFYNINGKIYFGEITFFHWSGTKPFDPPEWDKTLGDWIELPARSDILRMKYELINHRNNQKVRLAWC